MLFLRVAVSGVILVALLPGHAGFPWSQIHSALNENGVMQIQQEIKTGKKPVLSTKDEYSRGYEPPGNGVNKRTSVPKHTLAVHSTGYTERQTSTSGFVEWRQVNQGNDRDEYNMGVIPRTHGRGGINQRQKTVGKGTATLNHVIQKNLRKISDDRFVEDEEQFDPYSQAEQIQRYLTVLEPLIQTTLDFSSVAPGVSMMLGETRLNVDKLKLSIEDAMKLYHLLHGDSLSERMYVWGQSALLIRHSEIHSNSESKLVFQIERLDKFEGDMIFDRKEIDRIMGDVLQQAIDLGPNIQHRQAKLREKSTRNYIARSKNDRIKRKVTSDDTRYWSGPIPWKIDDLKFTPGDVEVIRAAVRHWESLTCIRFQDITDTKLLNKIAKDKPINRTVSPNDVRRALINRVYLGFPKGQGRNPPESTNPKAKPQLYFKRDNGCYSYLGKFGTGQDISIGPGCEEMGIVVHEIGHAIGFCHEHDRPDRDLYVTINREHIQKDNLQNFDIKIWKDVLTLGIPYDVSSLMHYSAIEWSIDDNIVLHTKDPDMQQVIGQRQGLSFLDAKLANYQFCSLGCRGHFSLDWSECQNGGYRNPNSCDECVCPSGWAPPKCQDVEVGRNIDCLQTSLTATQDPETLKSPKFEDRALNKEAFCVWHITASAGKLIKLTISEQFRLEYDQITCEQYVEVRYKDLTRPGPRFCSTNATTHELTSFGNNMMLLFHVTPYQVEDNNVKWFRATYQLTEGCGGCSSDQVAISLPACSKIEIYDCSEDTPKRKNSCYKETMYCCSPYQLQGHTCYLPTFKAAKVRKEPWGPWSEWSACSGTCGGCGWRSRERKCLRRRCRGDYLEWERCGLTLCPLPTAVPEQCKVESIGTSCVNGTRGTTCIQTRFEPCPSDYLTRRCCSGLTEDQSTGLCVLSTT